MNHSKKCPRCHPNPCRCPNVEIKIINTNTNTNISDSRSTPSRPTANLAPLGENALRDWINCPRCESNPCRCSNIEIKIINTNTNNNPDMRPRPSPQPAPSPGPSPGPGPAPSPAPAPEILSISEIPRDLAGFKVCEKFASLNNGDIKLTFPPNPATGIQLCELSRANKNALTINNAKSHVFLTCTIGWQSNVSNQVEFVLYRNTITERNVIFRITDQSQQENQRIATSFTHVDIGPFTAGQTVEYFLTAIQKSNGDPPKIVGPIVLTGAELLQN